MERLLPTVDLCQWWSVTSRLLWPSTRSAGGTSESLRRLSPLPRRDIELCIHHVIAQSSCWGRSRLHSAIKLEPFECGAEPVDPRNVRPIAVKYFGVAVAFILFDLETVFLFIWAVGAQPLTGFMLFTFFLFVFLLVLILLYVYKARLLEEVTQ